MLEVIGNTVMQVKEVQTKRQKAIVKEFHDMVNHVKLTATKTSILADGTDKTTITAKAYDYQENRTADKDVLVVLYVDGQKVEGQTIDLTSTTPGQIEIKAEGEGIRGGVLVVEAN
jgi:hypothetical protein